MRLLLRGLAWMAGILFLALAGSFLMPREIFIARTQLIAATPEQIFPHVNSLQQVSEWSPWAKMDPAMTVSFSGPEQGVGARMDWDSAKLGAGSQEIVASEANEYVTTALAFGDMDGVEAKILLEPTEGGTLVEWDFKTDLGMNPIARWMGLAFDRWIGGDFETGLATLKERVEAK